MAELDTMVYQDSVRLQGQVCFDMIYFIKKHIILVITLILCSLLLIESLMYFCGEHSYSNYTRILVYPNSISMCSNLIIS